MTWAELVAILNQIRYRPGWSLRSQAAMGDWWLQWTIADPQAPNAVWHCRKWRLSPHMTVSEVIQTAFLALQVAEEHELRERFTYRGVAVLGPHWDLAQLARLIDWGVVRESTRMDPLQRETKGDTVADVLEQAVARANAG